MLSLFGDMAEKESGSGRGHFVLGQGRHPPALVEVHCADGPEETFSVKVGFTSCTSDAPDFGGSGFLRTCFQEHVPLPHKR